MSFYWDFDRHCRFQLQFNLQCYSPFDSGDFFSCYLPPFYLLPPGAAGRQSRVLTISFSTS